MSRQIIEVVILEDDHTDAMILEQMLEMIPSVRFRTRVFSLLSQALASLGDPETPRPQVLLLDPGLPDSQGLVTFHTVAAAAPDVPVIVLTRLDDQVLGIKAVGYGAQDHLVKSRMDVDILGKSIFFAMERNRLILALKAQTKALEESRLHFYSIVEKSTDGIMVIDMADQICFMNAAALRLFKMEPGSFSGQPFGYPLAASGVTEIDIIRSDGKPGVVEMRVADTVWDGNPARLALLREMSDQKERQALEARNIQQDTLARMAGLLVADFQGPVRSLEQMFHHMADPDAPDCGTCRQGMAQALEDIRSTLDLFWGRTFPLAVSRTEVCCKKLVDDLFKRVSLPRAVSLDLDIQDPDLCLRMDPVLVRCAFEQIVSNAIQAMDGSGTLTVAVRTGSDPEAGQGVVFWFTDTGCGMDPGVMDRMSDPVFADGAGRGRLGLTFCRHVVKAHGGQIRVENCQGTGRRVRIFFPLPGTA